MLAVAVLGLLSVAAGSPATTPPLAPTPIEQLVLAYRSGRRAEAVAAAARWSATQVKVEIGRLVADNGSRTNVEERELTRLAAAAILTESALSRVREADLSL